MKIKRLNNLRMEWRFLLITALITVVVTINIYALALSLRPKSSISQPHSQIPQKKLNTNPSPTRKLSPTTISPEPASSLIHQTTSEQTNLGHFRYPEADPSQLMIISSYAPGEYQRFEKLEIEAALALMKMIDAARNEGVWIVPVSGFRSIAIQEQLFEAQTHRQGSPEAAAKLSAPPGYSEHHTGYAIDLADGHFPAQDITSDFAQTDAFKWLNTYAQEFGFELSFPQNNAQGVSYEPWHWRFTGSPKALEMFDRSLKPA